MLLLAVLLIFSVQASSWTLIINQTMLLVEVGRTQLIQTFNGKPIYNCNGIVVRPWWVLTSARCLVNSNAQFRFPQGSSLLLDCTSAGSGCPSYELQKIIPHPCFNPQDGFYHDDLALLQIKHDSSLPQPISYISIDGVDGSPSLNTGTPLTWYGIYKVADSVPADVASSGPHQATAKLIDPSICASQFQSIAAVVDGQTRIQLSQTLCSQDDAPDTVFASFLPRGEPQVLSYPTIRCFFDSTCNACRLASGGNAAEHIVARWA